METLRLILLVLHIVGFSALIGGLIVQAGSGEPKRVNPAMRDGVGTAFLAGLFLVGVLEAGEPPVDHGKVGVKLGIGLILLALVMANSRKKQIPQGLWAGLLVLSILNVCVAVFWSPAHAF